MYKYKTKVWSKHDYISLCLQAMSFVLVNSQLYSCRQSTPVALRSTRVVFYWFCQHFGNYMYFFQLNCALNVITLHN